MLKTAIEEYGKISEAEALATGSVNLEKLLGVDEINTDLVVTQGGNLLDPSSKIVAIISERKEAVDLL